MKMMLDDVDGLGQFIAKRLMKSELTIHMTDDPTRDKMEFCARKKPQLLEFLRWESNFRAL